MEVLNQVLNRSILVSKACVILLNESSSYFKKNTQTFVTLVSYGYVDRNCSLKVGIFSSPIKPSDVHLN